MVSGTQRENRKGGAVRAPASPQRLLVVTADALNRGGSIERICAGRPADDLELHVVVPAVQESPFRHAKGDPEAAAQIARGRLETSLAALWVRHIPAFGEVGDADPVLAAEAALRERPADEVVILRHPHVNSRWFGDDLVQRAQDVLEPPLRMIAPRGEAAPRQCAPPRLSRAELAGAAVAGAAVLAGIVALLLLLT